jgi:hypothetical protein
MHLRVFPLTGGRRRFEAVHESGGETIRFPLRLNEIRQKSCRAQNRKFKGCTGPGAPFASGSSVHLQPPGGAGSIDVITARTNAAVAANIAPSPERGRRQ